MLKRTYAIAIGFVFLAEATFFAQSNVNLPSIKIDGKEYYYYKVEKGDSPYGICKKFGWEEEKLRACNEGLADKMAKGQVIYYPANNAAPEVIMPEKRVVDVNPEPITHKVSRGETVYSIAQLYGVAVDVIYSSNPDSRHGIKIGEVLTINQPIFNSANTNVPFFYTIRPGDTLYALAKKYNASVEDIIAANPGISEYNFQAGKNIKIYPNSRKTHMEKRVDEQPTVTGFSSYKVQKNDTWHTIAEASGIDATSLKKANTSETLPKKGEYINIPKIENVVRENYVEVCDVADSVFNQRKEIYERVNNISTTPGVVVSVVMSSPSSKSSIDFVRGFIMGVDNQKKEGYKIKMNVIDGSRGFATAETDSILRASNLIVGIYENNFPEELALLGDKNGIEVVNALDTKSTLYERHPSIIQILQPVEYFNDVVACWLYDNNPEAYVLMIGEIDTDDKFASSLASQFPFEKIGRISLEDFANFSFSPGDKYIVYSYAQKKDQIEPALDAIIEKKNEGADIIAVGRPVWVAYSEMLGEKFGQSNVIVPSRFYHKPSRTEVTDFESKFKSDFKNTPVNSYPQYAMLGYDMANYFLPTTSKNGGDYNRDVHYRLGMQNDIDIQRLNTWSGFLNTNAYLLRYLPEGVIDKIEIK